MKTLALFFALSLLILPNPTHCRRNPIRFPTATHVALVASDTPVLDTDELELRAGGVYSILSVNSEVPAGVRLVGGTECPRDVILSNDLSADPIIITPEDSTATQIFESTSQNFKFNISSVDPQCEDKEFWEVHYDPKSGQQILKTGDNNNGRYLFKIERVPSPVIRAYTIRYCPSGLCFNLSTYYDDSINATRLVFGGDSVLEVVFQKRTPPVLDADGAELLVGEVYNIVSVDDPEGEVALVQLNTTAECPRDVIIQDDNGSGEDRIVFSPAGWNPFVWESTFLSVEFSPLQPNPDCQNNLSWEIQKDPQSGQDIVKTGNNTLKLFKIELVLSQQGTQFYKITYCRDTECKNVGSYEDPSANNANRLALSDDVLPVVFKKATSVSTL